MRKKLATLLAGVVAASAALLSVHPAEAAQASQAAAGDGSITIYRDHNQVGSMYTWVIHPGACSNGANVVAYVLTYERQRASSIRFLAPNTDGYCNFLSTRSASWDHPYWGTCIKSWANGFNFGWPYNDNTDAWVLEHRSGCPNYY